MGVGLGFRSVFGVQSVQVGSGATGHLILILILIEHGPGPGWGCGRPGSPRKTAAADCTLRVAVPKAKGRTKHRDRNPAHETPFA